MSNHVSLPQCSYPSCVRTATRQPFEVELHLDPLGPCPALDAGGGHVASIVVAFCSWHADLIPAGPDLALRARRTTLVA